MLTKAEIEKYFIAEKQESLVFLVIGIAAIVAGPDFYFMVKNAGLPRSRYSLADPGPDTGRCRIYRIYQK